MRCGVCDGGFSKISEAHFGCSTARNKGETVCGNRLTIRRDALEATVMDGLRSRLMDPVLFKAFAGEFTAEWNRLQADAGANLDRLRSEKDRVCRQIDRLVEALAEGEPAARLMGRLRELEQRRLELERGLETAAAPAPRLHPNIAEVYRRKVSELQNALRADDAGPARELIRGLVEAILLMPEDGKLRVEVRGELAAILRLSGCANEKAPTFGPGLLVAQIKLVAGSGVSRRRNLNYGALHARERVSSRVGSSILLRRFGPRLSSLRRLAMPVPRDCTNSSRYVRECLQGQGKRYGGERRGGLMLCAILPSTPLATTIQRDHTDPCRERL